MSTTNTSPPWDGRSILPTHVRRMQCAPQTSLDMYKRKRKPRRNERIYTHSHLIAWVWWWVRTWRRRAASSPSTGPERCSLMLTVLGRASAGQETDNNRHATAFYTYIQNRAPGVPPLTTVYCCSYSSGSEMSIFLTGSTQRGIWVVVLCSHEIETR